MEDGIEKRKGLQRVLSYKVSMQLEKNHAIGCRSDCTILSFKKGRLCGGFCS